MRQIDNMTPQELEMLHVKNMLTTISMVEKAMQPKIDPKRISIQRNRIDACDTLIDHIHDDIPHKDQEPLLDLLRSMRSDLEDEMEDALTP